MSLSVETLAVARKYTDDSLAGAGAVAGVPCKIQSITAITGGNRVTFLWTDNNGDDHTSAMDVMNGVDGEDGKGIQSVAVNAQDHLIITYTDGTTVDAGQIEIHSSVDSVNGQTGAVVLDAEDVGALPDNTPIPSKTSDLTNDSGFATTSDVSTALADYTKTADLTTLLAAKQDTLTFDNVPTENSNNPVKSGGIYAVNQTLTNQIDGHWLEGGKNVLEFNTRDSYITHYVSGSSVDRKNNILTLNGTASSSGSTYVNLQEVLPAGTYKLVAKFSSGRSTNDTWCTVGYNEQQYATSPYNKTSSQLTQVSPTFTTDGIKPFSAYVYTNSGAVYDNFSIQMMIVKADVTDYTFEPYAKSNKELTDDASLVNVGFPSIASDYFFSSNSYVLKKNGIVDLNFAVSQSIAGDGTEVKIFTLPAGSRPKGQLIVPIYRNAFELGIVIKGWVRIATNGDVSIFNNSGTAYEYLGTKVTFIAYQ